MSLAAPYRLLLAAVAPPRCPACATPLSGSHDRLCEVCARELPWLGASTCGRCALPLPCAPCPGVGRAWERAWAPFAHEGPARSLVVALKFRGLLAAADLLAAPLAAGAGSLLEGAALVALARRSGRPLEPCLHRPAAPRQLGAGRSARLARASRSAPAVVGGDAPARVVLIDDVHTTGATLDACARALRAGGSESVHVLTATRAVGR
jgi:predicted amidophosphoribosyltransferase